MSYKNSEISYAETDANITVSSTSTLIDFGTVAFDGSPHIFSFNGLISNPGGNHSLALYIDGAQVGNALGYNNATGDFSVAVWQRYAPSAGNHAVTIKGTKASGANATWVGQTTTPYFAAPLRGRITKA